MFFNKSHRIKALRRAVDVLEYRLDLYRNDYVRKISEPCDRRHALEPPFNIDNGAPTQ